MSTYSIAPAVVNPEVKPITDPLAEMQANIDDLVARMSAALDAIAEAAGAWHCQAAANGRSRPSWLQSNIDEMGTETTNRTCPVCGGELMGWQQR